MARKNPFASMLNEVSTPQQQSKVTEYAARGASRSILHTLDEMAAQADRVVSGEVIVELEPDLVDASFVRDRRAVDEQEFNELVEAIRGNGQNSPILVRPHPTRDGRYMVVFGHRRLQVAKVLGRKVKAVVKQLADKEHVLTLGQENSARANVPFIEKARFASDLAQLRYDEDNEIILKALSIDRSTLSKLLSVASIPNAILDAIGEARSIGRDRWYELKLLLDKPTRQDVALQVVVQEEFLALTSEARFEYLVKRLKETALRRRTAAKRATRNWASANGTVSAEISSRGPVCTLAIKAKDAQDRGFGDFVSDNLDRLYEAFLSRSKT